MTETERRRPRNSGWTALIATVTTAVALTFAATAATAVDADLAGPYCETRPRGCCKGRQDDCSVPLLGTLCYCDDFCNHTRSEDCCPDYLSYCKGVVTPKPQPPEIKQCYANGQYYKYGETVNVNCNECRCQESNGKLQLMCSSNECLIDPYLLDTLRHQANRLGWSARNYSEYWGRRYDEGLRLRLGVLHSKKKISQMRPLKAVIRRGSLQRSYDVRKVWGKDISEPIDQGWCAASWAITTAQIISDRFHIMSRGAVSDLLSPQHLLSCNSLSQMGCEGGHLTRAWNWIRKFGLVSEECYPWEGQITDCQVPKKKNELFAPCPRTAGPNRLTKTPLHRVGPVYRVETEEGIMHEILTSGPVQAVMKVFRDFFVYKSGIYKCTNVSSGSRTGYHSVRIVGWGEEYQNGQLVKYWIVSNSWGRLWGENGYFRILKGVNECQIEDFVIAAWADIDDFDVTIPPPGYDTLPLKSGNAI